MSPRGRLPAAGLVAASALVLARGAAALETAPLGSAPVLVETTESASLIVNLDNRNDRPADVASRVDDDWAMFFNRLHTQASWTRFRLDLRLDSAVHFASRSPSEVGLALLREERRGRAGEPHSAADGAFFVRKYTEAGDELVDRFVDWTYPAKVSLAYETPGLEATLGDFYAQYGQGLVLSVRKQDELSSDTTVRGVRLVGKHELGSLRFRLGGLAGTMNPLRIDDASGRHLAVSGRTLSGASSVTEAGMPRAITNDFVPLPEPSYLPDTLVGLELAGRSDVIGLGAHGTRLTRQCQPSSEGCLPASADLVRSAGMIDTAGVFLDLPRLGEGAVYVEYAHQRLADFRGVEREASSGNALYGRVSWFFEPVSLTVEGRHYRAFYPLRANIDTSRAREFAPVQYSAPPTTEHVWIDTEFEDFNTCVTGGRARADVAVGGTSSVFAWVGRYDTWGERTPGVCSPSEAAANHVWDVAQGIELATATRRSHGHVTVGARFDQSGETLNDASGRDTDVFYRELYLRHDISVGLPGDAVLQFQAWHRRRRQTLGGPEAPWLQGQTVTALQLGAHWGVAFGFEYDQNPAFPTPYVNGQLRYDFDVGNLTLFAGQRQGGLRCVSGICRIFPPFEGVRLDATLRF